MRRSLLQKNISLVGLIETKSTINKEKKICGQIAPQMSFSSNTQVFCKSRILLIWDNVFEVYLTNVDEEAIHVKAKRRGEFSCLVRCTD